VTLGGYFHRNLADPGWELYADSNYDESQTDIFGSTLEKSTYSRSVVYESGYSFGLDVFYAITERFGVGASYHRAALPVVVDSVGFREALHSGVHEITTSLRLSRSNPYATFAYRPAMKISVVGLGKMTRKIEGTDTTDHEADDPEVIASMVNDIVLRVTPVRPASLFVGFEQTFSPYLSVDTRLRQEIAFGLYTGIGINILDGLYIDPYVTIPLGSSETEHRSPPGLGLVVNCTL
jgi:hypothetical protein